MGSGKWGNDPTSTFSAVVTPARLNDSRSGGPFGSAIGGLCGLTALIDFIAGWTYAELSVVQNCSMTLWFTNNIPFHNLRHFTTKMSLLRHFTTDKVRNCRKIKMNRIFYGGNSAFGLLAGQMLVRFGGWEAARSKKTSPADVFYQTTRKKKALQEKQSITDYQPIKKKQGASKIKKNISLKYLIIS